MTPEYITEAKYSGNLLIGFVISDKSGNLLFRYQRKTFSHEDNNTRVFIYPVPKFALITGGTGDWNINKTIYHMQPGDIFLLRPGCVRYFSNIDPDLPLTCEIFEFVPSFLKNMECLDIFRIEVTPQNTMLSHKDGANHELIELLEKVKNELHSAPDGCADMIRAYLTMLTVKAARRMDVKIGSDAVVPWSTTYADHADFSDSPPFEYSKTGSRIGSKTSEHAITMAYVMDTIRNNASGDISIDRLADNVHMSRSHFFRVFKKHNGISVNEYIIKCRVENTVRLLTETGCNILDAAYASGFTSSSGFYKAFSKVTGTSPKEYLKRQKESLNK